MIDTTDKTILKLLQANSKMTMRDMSALLGLTASPIFERIKRLEREGYIKQYTTKVDFQKLGMGIVAFCGVTLSPCDDETRRSFEEAVRQLPEVAECFRIIGACDYLLKIFAADMEAYSHFLTRQLASLPGVERMNSTLVSAEL